MLIAVLLLLEGLARPSFLPRGLASSDTYAWFWSSFFAIVVIGLVFICRYLRQAVSAASDAVLETRRAAQANLLSQLLSEYASPDMQEAIRKLHRWNDAHPGDSAAQFIALLEKQDPEGDRLDGYRRYTCRWFHKIRALCQLRLIEPEWIDFAFTNEVAIRFLDEVLEPMQRAHRIKIPYDKELSDYYRQSFERERVHRTI